MKIFVLDVGYDGIFLEIGFINNILNRYFNEYFLRVVNLFEQLRVGEYVENFVYIIYLWFVVCIWIVQNILDFQIFYFW